MFEKPIDGFKIATREEKPLVCLTIAQAFSNYNYPIPSIDNKYSTRLNMYYEMGSQAFDNALDNGFILCNEDYSAVLIVTNSNNTTKYNINSLVKTFTENGEIKQAQNVKDILSYVIDMEKDLRIDNDYLYIETFAVQTPRQGNKLGCELLGN